MKTQLVNLKGGAKLLYNRQKDINGISVRFIFKAGSLNDPEGKLGVAHFLEHAICNFANVKMNRKQLESYAKRFQYRNAFTAQKIMTFEISTVESEFDDAIDFITESFLSIKFLKEDFLQEQKVIEDEIKMRYQINNRLVPIVISSEVFDDEAYNRSVDSPAGTLETFSKITLEDLIEFKKKYLTLNNLTICVCGNIAKRKVIKTIKKYAENRIEESGVDGYDVRNLEIKKPGFHFREALEDGKSKMVVFYDLKKIPFTYEICREEIICEILTSILQEKVFNFFRIENELCYECKESAEVRFGHLINDVEISCQEENLKKVLQKFKEYIHSGKLTEEDFNKHKNKVTNLYNFDFLSINDLTWTLYNVFDENKLLYDDKFKRNINNLLHSVNFQETKQIFNLLYKVKPHVIIIASKKYKNLKVDNYCFNVEG